MSRASAAAPRAVVLHEEDCPLESWTEESARAVRWRLLLSGGRTPTRGLTLGVAELPAGGLEAPVLHRHAQVEVYYVLAGTGIVSVDGVEHPVRPGSTVYIPGNAHHGARNTGEDTLRLLYVFDADSFDDVEYDFTQP